MFLFKTLYNAVISAETNMIVFSYITACICVGLYFFLSLFYRSEELYRPVHHLKRPYIYIKDAVRRNYTKIF